MISVRWGWEFQGKNQGETLRFKEEGVSPCCK